MKWARLILGVGLLVSVGVLAVWQGAPRSDSADSSPAQRAAQGQDAASIPANSSKVEVGEPVTPVLTLAARDVPPYVPEPTLDREINPRVNPFGRIDDGRRLPGGPDPLLALQAAAPAPTDDEFGSLLLNRPGQGFTFVNPPDTAGDVGTQHYVQMVNSTVVAIYSKASGELLNSFELETLGGCASGTGDPIVLYDHLADRWLLSEFGAGNSLCVFISQTPDPAGAYFSYQFNTPNFPDYPKYGVWTDGYYVTTNENSPANYVFDRAAMLAGQAASSQRFTAPDLGGFGFQALTPSDLDGSLLPPDDAPNLFVRHRDTEAHGSCDDTGTTDCLELFAFDVDWDDPGNSTFTKLPDVAMSEFDSDLCGLFSFSAIAMPGVAKCNSRSLDPLREVVMFRFGYRNFGEYESVVGNFVTDVTGADDAGIRWFELRKQGDEAWTLHQEGTYAIDDDSRWMGAIAMDGSGNIALAYNVSSSSTYPSLRYAGRLDTDPPGTLPQGEYTIIDGSGANSSNRYGDYSALSVDPVDDCTFWFTGEYNPSTQWATRIASFRFADCGESGYLLSATPAQQTVCVGDPATFTVNISPQDAFAEDVALAADGAPGTVSLTPDVIAPSESSVLTIGDAPVGAYAFEVVGTSVTTSLERRAPLQLDVIPRPGVPTLVAPAADAVRVPVRPSFSWDAASDVTGYRIEVAEDAAFSNVVISAETSTTSYTATDDLNSGARYYWRVTGLSTCGEGEPSTTFSFVTEGAPGECLANETPLTVYADNFEAETTEWTSSSVDGPDTWVITTTNPFEGVQAWHADSVAEISDQRLESPPIALPTDMNSLTLSVAQARVIERLGSTACYDGGVVEISADSGATWDRLDSEILVDPYTGPISTEFDNPLAGERAWCGNSGGYQSTVVDLSAFAGQTVQLRFRLGTDSSVDADGWDIDNVLVEACEPPERFDIFLPILIVE